MSRNNINIKINIGLKTPNPSSSGALGDLRQIARTDIQTKKSDTVIKVEQLTPLESVRVGEHTIVVSKKNKKQSVSCSIGNITKIGETKK